jgi:hypothetical protein
MPQLSAQTRFLLRGSALLFALLVLWWFVLSGPMVAALRTTVEITGSLFFGGRPADLVHEALGGEWTFHVPFETIVPATPQQPASAIHSVDFDLSRKDVNGFTFSLPVFWAIMLAAPALRRNLRALATGSIVMAAVELLLLMLLVEINARNTVAQLTPAQSGAEKWLLHFGEYLVVVVLPYAVPFVLALSLHGDLRRQILGSGAEPEMAAVAASRKPKSRASGK